KPRLAPCRLAPRWLSRLWIRAQPSGNQRSVVDKRQLVPIEVAQTTHSGQLSAKRDVPLAHAYDAGDVRAPPVHDANPVPHNREGSANVIAVRADVLTRNVGAEYLIAVRIAIQDQTHFRLLPSIAELSGAEENA